MAEHRKLSPSAAYRWMNCYGSVALIGDESTGAGEPAMRGTAAHKIIETMGERGETDANEYAGFQILVKKDGDDDTKIFPPGEALPLENGWHLFIADERMIDGVQIFVDEVERVKLTLDHPKEFGERFLDMTWLDPRLGGTADKTLVEAFGWAHLFDYKNGYVVVEVKDNEQMKNYAVGILHEHPDVEGVTVTVVQPNAPHEEGFIRSESYTRDELKLFEIQMKQAADETAKPNASRRAGDWCLWCPAKTRCPEFENRAASEAAEDFGFSPEDGRMPDTIVSAFNGSIKINDGDLVALARKAAVVPLVDKWCREIEGALQNALMNGNAVEGYKLVQGKSQRRWNEDEKTIKRMLSNGLGSEEFDTKVKPFLMTAPEIKSPAQVEKIGDKALRKLLKPLVGEMTVRPPGKLTVADAIDPRPACTASDAALDDFGSDPINEEGDD